MTKMTIKASSDIYKNYENWLFTMLINANIFRKLVIAYKDKSDISQETIDSIDQTIAQIVAKLINEEMTFYRQNGEVFRITLNDDEWLGKSAVIHCAFFVLSGLDNAIIRTFLNDDIEGLSKCLK